MILKLIFGFLAVSVLQSIIGISCETIPLERLQMNEIIMEKNAIMARRTVQFVEDAGYPLEEHRVQTADGYLLTMHRIPYGRLSGPAANKPVVFLQHGLLCSSADWVLAGPEKGLGFILADEGYDVWMGNVRGNTHSRAHVHLNPASRAFWDFSWHQIGQFDLPAMIDYTLANTGQSALHYIGHSQGTTSFFVMGSERPEYNGKIRSMHALAPVAFMSNLVSPFVRALSLFVDQIELVMNLLGVYEFLPNHDMMVKGGYYTCRDEAITQDLCAVALFLIGGFNSDQLNKTIIPTILSVTPAGASVNQLVHYGQGVNSGRFRQYDHGLFGNLAEYGTISPPDYVLSRITAPVALHYGDNDWLAAVRDVDELFAKLGNPIGKFRVPHNRWNHLDFTWGIDARPLLYDRIINLMSRY